MEESGTPEFNDLDDDNYCLKNSFAFTSRWMALIFLNHQEPSRFACSSEAILRFSWLCTVRPARRRRDKNTACRRRCCGNERVMQGPPVRALGEVKGHWQPFIVLTRSVWRGHGTGTQDIITQAHTRTCSHTRHTISGCICTVFVLSGGGDLLRPDWCEGSHRFWFWRAKKKIW